MTGPGRNTTQSEPPPAPLQYTFVNQHEDVRSVLDRRIHNEAHRHEIRSHVMRGVRQHEQALGKKRPTGRPPASTRSTEGASSNARRSSAGDNVVSSTRERSSEDHSHPPLPDNQILTRTRSQPPTSPPLWLYNSSNNHLLDPFATMPNLNVLRPNIDSLLYYCISTFLPMSFPVEKQVSEREARYSMMFRSQTQNPSAFFGFIAMLAAHRAFLYHQHEDLAPSDRIHADLITAPNYRRIFHGAVQIFQEKLDQGDPVDGGFLESSFSLMAAACIIGDFKRTHSLLCYVNSVLRNVEVPEAAKAWLPLVDIKTAVGTLSKPIRALPWAKDAVPADVLERIRPPLGSRSSQLGTAFHHVPNITSALRQLLDDAVIICQFCDFSASNIEGLNAYEHIIYRCKTHELEHAVLSYVYDVFPYSNDDTSALIVPALEQLVRLAILGILSVIAAVVHPASGLGRALTHHQRHALHAYSAQIRPDVDPAELGILVWTLFVFAQSADDQVERPEFEYLLAQTCAQLELRKWDEVEEVVLGCLYVPSVQGSAWRKCWERVQDRARGWEGPADDIE